MCATRRVLCAVALGLLLAVPVHAQVTTADLVGRVTDTSGGVLPGATVTLTNEGTRDVRVATTGDGGDYVFNLCRSAATRSLWRCRGSAPNRPR